MVTLGCSGSPAAGGGGGGGGGGVLCGNGQLDGGEACDGAVGLDSCALRGFGGGVLACAADCGSVDESGCFAFPTQIILFIGDGMGYEQVRAGGFYRHGSAGSLFFETLPVQGSMTTANASGGITDSAAAATAMATGNKVANGVISMAIPGDSSDLTTALESASGRQRATGLVTTTYITHATPAAFGAHDPLRTHYAAIGVDYFTGARPDVLFGGARYVSATQALNAGYQVVTDRAELQALDVATAGKVAGQFGADHLPYVVDGLGTLPDLAFMTEVALALLERDPDGFFLMVEGGRIDHAGHANDIARLVGEVAAFDDAVLRAYEWAQGREDVLIIVTADHETGGLSVQGGNGAGQVPSATFSTFNHTGVPVPIYAWGSNADWAAGDLDNTLLFDILDQAAP